MLQQKKVFALMDSTSQTISRTEKKTNHYSYLDLSLHCNAKQCNEIHDENRPENRDIEEIKECTYKCNDCSFCG